ncbi:uncharacterized protein LOC125088579 [Lutra lutra]|uniref:uncharacterized protein LOC125088579 n=1 Tax=Lutra lutra TaxID=9657 RepID=UPI001FD21DEE|nr:uncharacterized protein LOC125088579 [Lutra lutra]
MEDPKAVGRVGRVLGTTSPSGPCGPNPVPEVGVGRDADLSLRAGLPPEDVLGTLTGQSLWQFGIPADAQGTVAQSGHRSRDRERAPAPRALPTCAPGRRGRGSALRPSACVPACAPRAPRRPARLRGRRPERALPGGGNPACRVPRRGAASRAGEEYRRGNRHLVLEGLSAEPLLTAVGLQTVVVALTVDKVTKPQHHGCISETLDQRVQAWRLRGAHLIPPLLETQVGGFSVDPAHLPKTGLLDLVWSIGIRGTW